jgi:hypothetical protein
LLNNKRYLHSKKVFSFLDNRIFGLPFITLIKVGRGFNKLFI